MKRLLLVMLLAFGISGQALASSENILLHCAGANGNVMNIQISKDGEYALINGAILVPKNRNASYWEYERKSTSSFDFNVKFFPGLLHLIITYPEEVFRAMHCFPIENPFTE